MSSMDDFIITTLPYVPGREVEKDLGIVLTSPVNVPYGADFGQTGQNLKFEFYSALRNRGVDAVLSVQAVQHNSIDSRNVKFMGQAVKFKPLTLDDN